MARSKEKISFEATIPLLQSAIQISGDGGARVKIDIPENEMQAVTELLSMRGEVLKITVEVE